MTGVETYFSRVISGLLTSCLKVEQAYQLSLSSLYCIAKMLDNVSFESLQESAELVQTVKTFLHDESEDHRAAALYLFSFFISQLDLEVMITAILLSSSEHEKTREASQQLLTNLAEVGSHSVFSQTFIVHFQAKSSPGLLDYLKSDSESELVLIIDNILTDQVLFKDDYQGVLEKALEFTIRGKKKSRENSIILITKILESFSSEVPESLSLKILEKLVELLDDSEANIKRICADSIGIVMLSIER